MYTPMFLPPRDNRFLMRLTNALLPLLSQSIANLRGVQVRAEDFARLEELRGSRAVLTPNHPTGNDPIVVFYLSRMLGQPFNYVCAREALRGPKGWFLNQIGAYSIIRGTADRESLRMTRRLLAEHDRKVVIFPEGEIYEHNDTLLTFQTGVAQIGFWALDDLEKAGRPPALPLVPIAIKYRCVDSARPAMESGVRALEKALNLSPLPKAGAYQRLRRVGLHILARAEKDVGIKTDEERSLRERIEEYRCRLIERVARTLGTKIDERAGPADQLHSLYNDLRRWVGELPEDYSDYDETLYRRRLAIAEPLFHDLHRLQNQIALTGDYVLHDPTAERFLEVMGRLEKEVFGEVRTPVNREALVRIAPCIPLEARYEEYRKRKREVVEEVTRETEATIRAMLSELSREGSTPISLED